MGSKRRRAAAAEVRPARICGLRRPRSCARYVCTCADYPLLFLVEREECVTDSSISRQLAATEEDEELRCSCCKSSTRSASTSSCARCTVEGEEEKEEEQKQRQRIRGGGEALDRRADREAATAAETAEEGEWLGDRRPLPVAQDAEEGAGGGGREAAA